MKKSRTGSLAGEALAPPPVVTVQLPLPVLDVLADTRTAFFGLCLDAGQQVLRTLMEQERARLCGPKNVPNPERRAYRGGSVRGEVTLGGRRILVPRLRARSVDGHELELPSFAYAARRDPLNARTLEAIAIGVTTRKYRRALDPLPEGMRERAVSKSSVSRRFVALTSAQLTTGSPSPWTISTSASCRGAPSYRAGDAFATSTWPGFTVRSRGENPSMSSSPADLMSFSICWTSLSQTRGISRRTPRAFSYGRRVLLRRSRRRREGAAVSWAARSSSKEGGPAARACAGNSSG